MRIDRLIGLAVSIFWFATTAIAADIHVSPTGIDAPTGRGAFTAPYRSLTYVLEPANDLIRAGDRIFLRGPPGNNVYRQDEVRIRVPLTIQSFDGEWAVIECPITVPDGVCVQIDPSASGTTLRRLEVKGGTIYSVFLQTDFDQRGNATGRGASNITLEDCRLHGSGRDVVKITPKSDRVTIRRCEIFNSGQSYPPGTSVDNMNAEGIDNVNGSNMTVQDNYIHDIATSGVYWKGGAADALVERNRIERTGLGGILVGFDTSPEFFDLTLNPGYYEAVRGVVRNNIVRDTGYAGIGLFASRDASVVNNTIVNTARLGHAGIYFGVTLQDFDAAAARPANTNATILNNIVVQSGGECASIRFANDLGGLSGLSGASGMDGNHFHNATGACRFRDRRTLGNPIYNGGTFAQWRQVVGGDAASTEGGNPLDSNGRLTNTGAGAALIGRGLAVSGLTVDFDRRVRPSRPDVGANQSDGVECGLWSLWADCDGDGMPNIVEQIFGNNPDRRDNDIFGQTPTQLRLFVMQQYRDFLAREGDAGGIDFWVAEMSAGRASRAQMAQNYVESAEFQGRIAPVARAYFTALGRFATFAELTAGRDQFAANGGNVAAIIGPLATGSAFVTRYGVLDNRAFVDRLYRNGLGRAADASATVFVDALDRGTTTRAAFAALVSESPEAVATLANRVYVSMMYAGMLRREPDVGGFDFWVSQMTGGRSGLDLVGLFIASPEYRARFLS
jgi:Right handed beta helix region/Domain of unknown function (DUF4214)